ncbi:hypothetical protein [Prosthecomicrobium pneumaticum]|uniref:Uncharacterized protein n=1 Tax=Prosthecomicrobium pneumaticum TaxID=81895 RepID=A0A7W9CUN3_9HYPH|nr:hypothetical protein [Prosthecomicrobium pneumaticum]MBB5751959.1 hypothetical protein [Prosthecomicrobium pneumaticum]
MPSASRKPARLLLSLAAAALIGLAAPAAAQTAGPSNTPGSGGGNRPGGGGAPTTVYDPCNPYPNATHGFVAAVPSHCGGSKRPPRRVASGGEDCACHVHVERLPGVRFHRTVSCHGHPRRVMRTVVSVCSPDFDRR